MFETPVTYNGFQLNTLATVGEGGVRRGCMLEVFDYSRSQGVGYTEKRAQDDGLDASDVYMGPRYISLAGTIYGSDEADLYDLLQDLRTALTPTSAYATDKWDQGYIPLEFSLPTKDNRFPPRFNGWFQRDVEYRARPVGQPSFSVRRDAGAMLGQQGQAGGAAIQWSVQLECKDPRLYVRPDSEVPWTTEQSGVAITNRGDYPAPLDVILIINNGGSGGGFVDIAIGGSQIRIKTEGLATNTLVRYSGELKVLTIDNAAGGTADVLRMDLFTLMADKTHPRVMPSDDDRYPGDGKFTIIFGGSTKPTFKAGTKFVYSESFA